MNSQVNSDYSMMKSKLLLIAMLAAQTAAAQESAHILGIGSSNVLDTYLSQEKYNGTGLTYLYIRERVKPEKHWGTIVEHEMSFSVGKDRNKQNSMMTGDYNLYWGRYHRWSLCHDRLQLYAGAAANATVGFLYTMQNSNNPAQLRASLQIMPSAIGKYAFTLWRQQFSLRYEANLPLLGLAFSPNYGQSYYEIFGRGDYDHNIVPTTFISAPTFRQLVTLDWQISSRYRLRIGYLGNFQQQQVNNLKQHLYTQRIILGIVIRK